MRWKGLRRSSNVDDVRGSGPSGLPMRLPIGGKGGGIGIIVVLVVLYFIGGPDALMSVIGGGSPTVSVDSPSDPGGPPARPKDEAGDFVTAILGSTEDAWTTIFTGGGEQYVPPQLTIFDQAVNSACGFNTSAVGPFYCPPDRACFSTSRFSTTSHAWAEPATSRRPT